MKGLTQQELHDGLLELVDRIEACGASPALTHAVTLCSDLRSAVGDEHNKADGYSAERVRLALKSSSRDYIKARHHGI